MHKINLIHEIIVRTLFSSSNKKLDSFSIFKKTGVSFSDFTKNLNTLAKEEYVVVDGFLIILTKKGFDYAAMTPSRLNKKDKTWRKVPLEMLGPKLEPHYKYIPSIRLLNKKLKNSIDS